jgi:GT2 family glycosyltransferase
VHGHGLGVLSVGRDQPKVFQDLLEASDEDISKIRNFFLELGHKPTLQQRLAENERVVVNLNEILNERDAHISHLEMVVREKEAETERLRAGLAEKEREVGSIKETINQKASQISHLEAMVREKDGETENLKEAMTQKDLHISQLEGLVRERNADAERLKAGLAQKEAALNRIYNSYGWKVLLICYRLMEKIFPGSSRRRRAAKIVWSFIRMFMDKRFEEEDSKITYEAGPILRDAAQKDSYGSESKESTSFFTPCMYENAHRSEVAAILVNYNCGKYVAPFFSSLWKQTLPPNEIILFDNGSTDGSLEFISEEYPEVRIIRNHKNLGFSVPNNRGIRQTCSKYVLISNLDVVFEPNFIEQMVIPLESDSRLGWVAGKIHKLTDHGPAKDVDCFAHHMQRDRYANALSIRHPDPNDPYYQEPGIRWGAPACCALYRRRMLEEIAYQGEYFDEDFFAYFEDVDLDWRANLYGSLCYYQPSAVAYHVREGTKGVLEPRIMAGLVMNRFFMMVKNDRVQDIFRDGIPILKGTVFALRRMFRECPKASFYLFSKLTLFPRMLRKRRLIFSKRKTSPEDIRKWFN